MIQNRHEISDYRVRRVINLLNERPDYRVNELAKLVNLSASRLEHLFKQETNEKLSKYIQEQKLNKATELLRETAMQIKEISFTVGYGHSTSFVRAFKEQYQQTPQRYRGTILNRRGQQLILSL